MARKRFVFRQGRQAKLVGYGAILLGSYALWEAYEKRGRGRPFVAKFLPGP
jgi:hypothetical protein